MNGSIATLDRSNNHGPYKDYHIPDAIKAHACLMLLAFGFCCPNALLAARHFKKFWPGRTFHGLTYWFNIHLSLQAVLIFFVVVAVMTVVVHEAGYSSISILPYAAHPALGFVVFILVVLSPLIAWFMITSTGSRRSLFRNFHLSFGLLAQALSVPMILIGFNMPPMGERICASSVYTGMYITSIIFYLLIEITLEIIGYILLNKVKKIREKYEQAGLNIDHMVERVAHEPRTVKSRYNLPLLDREFEGKEDLRKHFLYIQRWRVVKYFIYGVHLVINFSIIFVIVVMIGGS